MNELDAAYHAHQAASRLAIEAARNGPFPGSAKAYNKAYKEVFRAVYAELTGRARSPDFTFDTMTGKPYVVGCGETE